MSEKVSIVVPIFNVEEYIEDCIKSLICQTYRNLQIILIDDGSTDSSGSICDRFAAEDNRIQVIHKLNGGLSDARNVGIEYAVGKFLMFVDGDDWLDLECVNDALRYSKGNYDVVMWSYIREYSNKGMEKKIFPGEKSWEGKEVREDIDKRLFGPVGEQLKHPELLDSIVTVWGKLYKRELVQGYYFVDTKLIGSEDLLFNAQVFENVNSVKYIDMPYYHYRKGNKASLSGKYNSSLLERRLELYKRLGTEIENRNYNNGFLQALKNRIVLDMISFGFNELGNKESVFFSRVSNIKNILTSKHYCDAMKSFSLKYLSLPWKLFFSLCKNKHAFLLTIYLYIINYMRNKI